MVIDEDTIFTVSDARASGLCLSGQRLWAKAHNLDFRAYVQNGIRLADLPQEDAAVKRMVARKIEQGATDGRR